MREDIVRHFREKIGIELAVFDGGAERTNLSFEVIPTTSGEKFAHIHQALESHSAAGCPRAAPSSIAQRVGAARR